MQPIWQLVTVTAQFFPVGLEGLTQLFNDFLDRPCVPDTTVKSENVGLKIRVSAFMKPVEKLAKVGFSHPLKPPGKNDRHLSTAG